MKIDRVVCIEPMTPPAARDDTIVGITVVRAVQSVRVAVGKVDADTATQSLGIEFVVVRCVAPHAARATSRPSVRLKPMRAFSFFFFSVSSFRQSHREATCDGSFVN